MLENSPLLKFRVDPGLKLSMRKKIEGLISSFKEYDLRDINIDENFGDEFFWVIFYSENSAPGILSENIWNVVFKSDENQLFNFSDVLVSSGFNLVIDDSVEQSTFLYLLRFPFDDFIRKHESTLNKLSIQNLKRMDSLAKKASIENENSGNDFFEYSQYLIEFQKELIGAVDELKIEKIIKQFLKNSKLDFNCNYVRGISSFKEKDLENILPLPRIKGQYHHLCMNWNKRKGFDLLKQYFFYHSVVKCFQFREEGHDPFDSEILWREVLDLIPFPLVLLTTKAEVCQHNSLFSKLRYTPQDCLKLGVKEKVVINEIPYNIFRKEISQLGEDKILIVFFTESFFLKGDTNHLPSGQELGIISSSIAHELNNPIAGIQAAISVLMLDVDSQNRCKQLIETFLGFSRANLQKISSSGTVSTHVEICYQQAQNLLRFRTVESGIRFNLVYSKHSDFKAEINPSLLTMTFYLILGELMTLYSHQMLLHDKNQIEKNIKGELVESSQEILIQFSELNINQLLLSKLVQNLLNIENLVLQVSEYSLRFLYHSSKGDS